MVKPLAGKVQKTRRENENAYWHTGPFLRVQKGILPRMMNGKTLLLILSRHY